VSELGRGERKGLSHRVVAFLCSGGNWPDTYIVNHEPISEIVFYSEYIDRTGNNENVPGRVIFESYDMSVSGDSREPDSNPIYHATSRHATVQVALASMDRCTDLTSFNLCHAFANWLLTDPRQSLIRSPSLGRFLLEMYLNQ
jgi:hypothetical protein